MASLQIPLSPILDDKNLAQPMLYYKPKDDVSGGATRTPRLKGEFKC